MVRGHILFIMHTPRTNRRTVGLDDLFTPPPVHLFGCVEGFVYTRWMDGWVSSLFLSVLVFFPHHFGPIPTGDEQFPFTALLVWSGQVRKGACFCPPFTLVRVGQMSNHHDATFAAAAAATAAPTTYL